MALKHLLIDGSLSTEMIIEAGEVGEYAVPLMFLAKGRYGFRAIVQAVEESAMVRFSSVLEVDVQ
jgi:hypothetical protein